MVVDQLLYITHDLRISLMSSLRHLRDRSKRSVGWLPCCCRLTVKHEGNSEETLISVILGFLHIST